MKSLIEIARTILQPFLRPKSLTVRYMFPVVLSLAAILGASAISSVDSSYVRLNPSKTIVMSGEQFYIEVYAYAHVPVNALDIAIQFDPNSLDIMSVDKAQSVLTIWSQEPKVQNNSITFGGGTYRRGFIGEHLIATIKVKAKSSGKTEFLIKNAQFLAGDGKGTPVLLTQDPENSEKSFIIYNQNEDPAKISADFGLGISADIDGDGTVTLKDISSFMAAWYSGGITYDFNNDSKMNFIDFSIILARSFFKSDY